MVFQAAQPDRKLSPKTGLSRRHWMDAGAYLLEGVFRHVRQFEDPIVFPKPSEVLYPKPTDPPWKARAMEFEGLARTFMLAAPILKDNPDLAAGGYKMRDYYANQILQISNPQSPRCVGRIADLDKQYHAYLYQHTVEGAALTLGLLASKPVVWDRYSKAEKDQVAAMLHDFAHARTNGHNWRWFNVMMASFLKLEGYAVDEALMMDHLQSLLAFYAGQGWYRDGALFDFYSAWAFQFYGPIWCRAYGYAHAPEIAAIIEKHHNELMESYPLMFGRNGYSLLWGRSGIYRCAAAAPLAAAFALKQPALDPGWARRIASGTLMQFIARDEFYVNGIPCLGFYGPFEPMLQGYSCAASPFWISKLPYMALSLPADSPFWTAREHDGKWTRLGAAQKTIVLPAPGLTITAHGLSGAAEVRNGKVNSRGGDPNYTRLVYNTAFPWESDSKAGATAMSYSIRDTESEKEYSFPVNLAFGGEKGGVLYRHCALRSWMARIDLADIILPGGVLRVDRLRIPQFHELHLGHFALPHVDGAAATVRRFDVDGHPAISAAIPGRRVALVALNGWEGVDSALHTGLNAEARESTVLFARRLRNRYHSGVELAVTLMLHRTDDGEWTPEELGVVKQLTLLPWAPSGQPCGLRVTFSCGHQVQVDFDGLEGRLSF